MEILSVEAKEAAAHIEHRLQLGSKLSDVVRNREDAHALFALYKDEGYILTEHEERFCVSEMQCSFLLRCIVCCPCFIALSSINSSI